MKMNIMREWIEKMATLEADHDITVGKPIYDDKYEVCKHGRVTQYRHPCKQCLGWRGYISLRMLGIWNDMRKLWWS